MARKSHNAAVDEHEDSPGDRAQAFAANLATVLEAAKKSGASEDVTKAMIEQLGIVVRTAQ